MEIQFPIEFLVSGTPVSSQAKRPESREEWKTRVKDASTNTLPRPHFASDRRIAATLFYFPDEPMKGDVDNIVKLTLDALSRHIYLDDSQIERVVVQKFEPARLFDFVSPTPTLVAAIEGERPVLYIRISDDPHEDLR
jgi:crossover junction endodeoxyribonuclease RusA